MRVLLFAQAREAAGHRRLTVAVPPGGRPLVELLAELRAAYPGLRPLLRTCRFAVNGVYVDLAAARLADGDELAVHPPFSGG